MPIKTLGKYELLEELGRGGFGTVYRARDTSLDVERAVKVLHPALAASPEFIERFRREGRFAARLEHPHIVPVYELGEADGSYYLAMKYLPGGSLKDLLARQGPLPFAQAIEITRQVAEALTYAHRQPEKLIHRDLKPGNILFESLPGGEMKVSVRLSDFGFAKALAEASTNSSSASGGMLGTPAYMAPEVWRGKTASPAADQYALACVLYEMLTGQTLFIGESPPEVMTKHVLDGPEFPTAWPSGVPSNIEDVLRRALAIKPEERYPDVAAFGATCAALLVPPVVVAVSPEPEKTSPPLPVEIQASQPAEDSPQEPEQIESPPNPTPNRRRASPMGRRSPTAPLSKATPVRPVVVSPPTQSQSDFKTIGWIVVVLLIITILVIGSNGGFRIGATPAPVVATDVPADTAIPATDVPAAIDTPEATATVTPYPMAAVKQGFTPVRWFIGLGTGTDPNQLVAEQSVVDDFNADPARATDKIQLIMEVVPYASAKDTILTEIAAGNGPDVIGPVGWNGSAALHGQWADLKAEIAAIPEVTADFDPALIKSYESSEGQIGLPFAVYPSAMFYNAALFDEAGLSYPPARYGDKYELDGKMVDWDWQTTVKTVAQRLTVSANGKNATEAGFDKTRIVQYGFTWNFEGQPSYVGTFWANGSFTDASGTRAQIPAAWVDSWNWTYDGFWGDKPFIPNGQVAGSADFGNGNPFNSGKVAMVDQPLWYTCCMGDVKTWEAGAMPSYKGKVNGRIDADTFRIWKGTKHKAEAFKVLTYLVTTGVQKLIIGSADMPPAYGALPARAQDFDAWLVAKKVQFPQVKNWDLIKAGLSYPDSPSAEAYMPNYNEAWARTGTFYSLMANTAGLDLEKEANTLMTDLQAIFDKK